MQEERLMKSKDFGMRYTVWLSFRVSYAETIQ